MDAHTVDRIRMLAYELSQRAERAATSPLDNWLDAERAVLTGLAESGAIYEPAPNTVEEPLPAPPPAPPCARDTIRARRH